jgi:hypothetical protein
MDIYDIIALEERQRVETLNDLCNRVEKLEALCKKILINQEGTIKKLKDTEKK